MPLASLPVQHPLGGQNQPQLRTASLNIFPAVLKRKINHLLFPTRCFLRSPNKAHGVFVMGNYCVCYPVTNAISALVKFLLWLNLRRMYFLSFGKWERGSYYLRALGVGGDLSQPYVLPGSQPHSEFWVFLRVPLCRHLALCFLCLPNLLPFLHPWPVFIFCDLQVRMSLVWLKVGFVFIFLLLFYWENFWKVRNVFICQTKPGSAWPGIFSLMKSKNQTQERRKQQKASQDMSTWVQSPVSCLSVLPKSCLLVPPKEFLIILKWNLCS